MSSLIPKKIGNMTYKIEKDEALGMRVPVVIYADDQLLEKMMSDRTIKQAVNVSTIPGVLQNVVVLPDGHEGYGFPVGGVAAMDAEEGMISPGGVGYDINCGVRLLRTNLKEQDVRPKLKELVNDLFNSIPSGVGSKGAIRLSTSQLDEVLVKGVPWAIDNGYGTKKDAEIHDEEAAKRMGIEQGQVTILTHCGSRGFGHQICSDYLRISEQALKKYNISLPDRELACVPNSSEEGESYRKAMFAALNFAWSNRQMITHWTRKSFERVLKQSEADLGMNLVYDVSHNIAKVEKHTIDGKQKSVVVHRKGATRAFPANREEVPKKYRDLGQPVFIPGSMGTASWILLGQPNSMNLTFGSTAHGAGRTMSRTKARQNYTESQVRKFLSDKGIEVKALTRDGIVEETPQAYKDVDSIVNVSHELGIATKVAKLVPIGVIKG